MMQQVKELEQDAHHLLIQLGSDQAKEMTMSYNKGRSIRNFLNQISELSRDLHEVDSNGISAHRSHDLQNRTKMNPLGLSNG